MLKSQAIKFFGNASRLGAKLGVTRQAVYQWPEELPDRWQYAIHHLSEGQLPLAPHLEVQRQPSQ